MPVKDQTRRFRMGVKRPRRRPASSLLKSEAAQYLINQGYLVPSPTEPGKFTFSEKGRQLLEHYQTIEEVGLDLEQTTRSAVKRTAFGMLQGLTAAWHRSRR